MTGTRRVFVLIMCCLFSFGVDAQDNPQSIRQLLAGKIQQLTASLKYPGKCNQFYEFNQYEPVWTNNELSRLQLMSFLKEASSLGLNEKDYQFAFIDSFRNNSRKFTDKNDSILADIYFTDAAIHFFSDVAFGNKAPDLGYNGLKYSPGCLNIPSLLSSSLRSGRFSGFMKETEPSSMDYSVLKTRITQYNKIIREPAFKELRIGSTIMSDSNVQLMIKLYQLKIIDSAGMKFKANDLKEKIMKAQRLFSLLEDGKLGPMLKKELNVPLAARVKELNRAINTIRWLRCTGTRWQHRIVVNIPSATLMVHRLDDVVLRSKVIVGKKSRRTPKLASLVTDIVIYPYWMVPNKIATRELLPLIKKDIGYLDANNFQVVNKKGKVLNPYNINWSELSVGYFPYILRQSTGCDNSLGIVKLNFYSPYDVYLHDTPGKSLFSYSKRFFSHGCIRVEKALDLAHLVLAEKSGIIEAYVKKGCLPDQKPVTIAAVEKMPVFVLYNTAWLDDANEVRFFGDIYNQF